jgi:hypothetical protein
MFVLQRKGSVDLRKESFDELMLKESTPLKACGSGAKILEIAESVTINEGGLVVIIICHFTALSPSRLCSIERTW